MFDVREIIAVTFAECPGNTIESLTIFDAPLTGVASAHDDIFQTYKSENIIGTHYMTPSEWLDGAKSVAAIFFPFTERVRKAERVDPVETSAEWLYGRIEGQNFINDFTRRLCDSLRALGIGACTPSVDERFKVIPGKFSSNWSERHAAFAAGLGTFGLSRGIITSRGMAGRLSSVIVDVEIVPDLREYERYDEYCVKCGACVRRCPAGAISFERGKEHKPCFERLNMTRAKYSPRYGCGKCQTAVPCEARNPSAKKGVPL